MLAASPPSPWTWFTLLAEGESLAEALTGGYHVAFLVGAVFAAAAAALRALLLRVETRDVEGSSRRLSAGRPIAARSRLRIVQPQATA